MFLYLNKYIFVFEFALRCSVFVIAFEPGHDTCVKNSFLMCYGRTNFLHLPVGGWGTT